MKRFMKRLAAAMLSAACVTGTAVPMSPGAVTTDYDPCDVNHSGSVNIMDVLALNKYLLGDLKATDYNRFDVNRDLVVNAFDSEYLMHVIVGEPIEYGYIQRNVSGTTYEEKLIDPPASYSLEADYSIYGTSRTYRRYSYLTHQEMSQYTLTLSETTLSNQIGDSINTVIGTDDRYRTPSAMGETRGIVYLSSGGTGFIVGDHEIATAAHCVYQNQPDTFIDNLSIRLYSSTGTLTNTYLTPIEAHIPVNTSTAITGELDYALITVEDNLSGYPHFEIGELCNLTDFIDIPIYVTGVPANVHDTQNSTHALYTAMGNITIPSGSQIDRILHHIVDMSPGDSGAPVYTITKYKIGNTYYYAYTAIGINTWQGSVNFGARFSRYHLQFYRNNPYISYENNTI